jgi:hypothetical protein
MNRWQIVVLWIGIAAFVGLVTFTMPRPYYEDRPWGGTDPFSSTSVRRNPDLRPLYLRLGCVVLVTAAAVLTLGKKR